MTLRRLSSLLIALLPTLLLAGLLAALARPAAAADGVVATCNDAAFSAVLNTVQSTGGGTITFSCSGTIVLASTKTITSNVTIDGGGNVTLSGGNTVRLFIVQAPGRATLRNLTVSNGFANDDGGAIVNHGHLSIQDSILRENNTISTFSGGAILNLGTLTATHASFINNTGGAAGAVYAYSDLSRITIRDSVFRNNRTTHTGSGLGGAIYLSGGAPAVISETQFISNTARDGGGAVLSFGSPVAVIDSQFISNAVTLGSGGGLYHTGAVTISGGVFMSNTASGNGGGVFAGGAATLHGGLFQGNRCMQTGCGGGGLRAFATLALTGTQFISNTSQSHGGGVLAQGGATLNGGLFQGNQCMQIGCVGGGLTAWNTLALTGTQFVSNTSGWHGGGAYANGAATLNGGLFQGNSCTDNNCEGGGLHSQSTLTVTASRLLHNSAAGAGGGLYHAAGAGVVTNTLFAGNTADAGAALYLASAGSVTLYHNTIASATVAAGSAVHVVAGSVTAVNNLIANSATGYERAGGSVAENYTLFSAVAVPRAGGIVTGAASFEGAAGFVNAASGDFQLGPTSQAIDEGFDVGVARDFFGIARPVGVAPDIGFHEFSAASLSISKTANTAQAAVGDVITYTIVVSNAGPHTAGGVLVGDDIPVGLTGAAWTCFGVGGGVCPAGGVGSISAPITLPAGGFVQFTLAAAVDAGAGGSAITNTATLTTPAGLFDPNPADNSASAVVQVEALVVDYRLYLPAIVR